MTKPKKRSVTPKPLAVVLWKGEVRRLLQANAELAERVETQSRVIGSSARDVKRSTWITEAVCDMADAADNLLSAGLRQEAEACLALVRRIRVVFLRERVSREPGGVNYVANEGAEDG